MTMNEQKTIEEERSHHIDEYCLVFELCIHKVCYFSSLFSHFQTKDELQLMRK